MNYSALFLPSILLCSFASDAWADSPSAAEPSVSLDYRAQETGCPTAERFADEVSSKLGFVPWQDASHNRLRVRIQRDGDEIVATLELPNGDSKVLRDATCEALFPSLVTTSTVALDTKTISSNGHRPSMTPPAVAPVDASVPKRLATIHVRTTEPGLIVSRITGRAHIAGSRGGTAAGVSWEEICEAPCTFEQEAGLSEILVSGNGPGRFSRPFGQVRIPT